jgi:uncharacterized protein YjlB
MIIPAGVSHCSSTATKDYRFAVFFPKVRHPPPFLVCSTLLTKGFMQGQPKWISVWCQESKSTPEYKKQSLQVPLPTTDPVQGPGGILLQRWREVLSS